MERRKRDNRKLFNVESSMSMNETLGEDEYGEPNKKNCFDKWYPARDTGKLDLLSGNSGLSVDSFSSFGALREKRSTLEMSSSIAESTGFQGFL